MAKDKETNLKYTKEEIDEMFADCHSNLETPLMGEIFAPICEKCKNLSWANNEWSLPVCQELGRFPSEYWEPDAVCPYRVEKE